jgi:hypothetical protein
MISENILNVLLSVGEASMCQGRQEPKEPPLTSPDYHGDYLYPMPVETSALNMCSYSCTL